MARIIVLIVTTFFMVLSLQSCRDKAAFFSFFFSGKAPSTINNTPYKGKSVEKKSKNPFFLKNHKNPYKYIQNLTYDISHDNSIIASKPAKEFLVCGKNKIQSTEKKKHTNFWDEQKGPEGLSEHPILKVRKGLISISASDLHQSYPELVKVEEKNALYGYAELQSLNGKEIPLKESLLLEETGKKNYVFIPQISPDPKEAYRFAFKDCKGNEIFSAHLFFAARDLCKDHNLQKVKVLQAKNPGEVLNLSIQETLIKDSEWGNVVLLSWNHKSSSNFHLEFQKTVSDTKYILQQAFGVYDIPGRECELYYQRSINPPFNPISGLEYKAEGWTMTSEDLFISRSQNTFYNFQKTYLVFRVLSSKDNKDLSNEDTSKIKITRTELFYRPENRTGKESQLLAYLSDSGDRGKLTLLTILLLSILSILVFRKFSRERFD
ncbi:MAG: hypothetical protein H7A25_19350 [Leptospiraceae bacterium]|nr:hypothetical protein [Leptospiraceae bacterium]MCP5502065.1 hypothetical protein [Leptospiraceae bacterium]